MKSISPVAVKLTIPDRFPDTSVIAEDSLSTSPVPPSNNARRLSFEDPGPTTLPDIADVLPNFPVPVLIITTSSVPPAGIPAIPDTKRHF